MSRALSGKCAGLEEEVQEANGRWEEVVEENRGLRTRVEAMGNEEEGVLKMVENWEREKGDLLERIRDLETKRTWAEEAGETEEAEATGPSAKRDSDTSGDDIFVMEGLRRLGRQVCGFEVHGDTPVEKVRALEDMVQEALRARRAAAAVQKETTNEHATAAENAAAAATGPERHYSKLTQNIAARITAAIAERIRITSKKELRVIEKAVEGAIKGMEGKGKVRKGRKGVKSKRVKT